MKKSLLLGITGITLVTLTATTLYAQATTGTSIVDKMKAAVHAFTLSASLNPGQTGLDSAPIKGKKTGDILTAGEYNRILELISEGGSGGSGWADVPLTDTADFDTECLYQVKLKVTDATNINLMNGDTSWRVGTIKWSKYLGLAFTDWTGASYAVWWIPSSNKQSFGYRDATGTFAPQNSVSVLGLKKLCGGGGSSTGGGVEIVEWGIIKTSAKTISNWDLITLEWSWNWGSDAAPSGGYIYKLNGQPRLSYVEASGISKDTVLTTTAQNVHNLTVKLSGDSVVIDPSSTNTLAYIVWKFGGGSAGSSWVDILLTDTADFDTSCEYRMKMNGVASAPWFSATGDYWYYSTAVWAKSIIYIAHESQVTHVNSNSKNSFKINGASTYTVLQMQKRCN